MNYLVALGFAIGGIDAILNNRTGMGEKFRQGFSLLGPMMLSMAGIMAFAPVLAAVLKPVILPLFQWLGIDPGMLGILMNIDMGGYQLATSLAEDSRVGVLAGLITSGMLGSAVNFTIPFGFSLIEKKDYDNFSKGLLIGLMAIPPGSILAGRLVGLSWGLSLRNNIPVITLSLLIALGLLLKPQKMVLAMRRLGKLIEWVGIVGLIAGVITKLTGFTVIPGLLNIQETMAIVCSNSITMIGMFPILEIFKRVFGKVLKTIGGKFGLDEDSCSGILFTMGSSSPVFPMMKDMCPRGVVMNAAWIVTSSAIFGSQMGLIMSVDSTVYPNYLAGKLTAGVLALVLAYLFCKVAGVKGMEINLSGMCSNLKD